MVNTHIFYIIISKFSYLQKFSQIILYQIDESLDKIYMQIFW